MSVEEDRKALEQFVVDNELLEQLEALSAEFNLFEAIGAVRRELHHSQLLAFLLDPNENHGLDDAFLRPVLQRALANAGEKAPMSPIELDLLDLDEVDVRREWRNIDILIADERNKMVVVIENKIYSTEHSNQLQRYKAIVAEEFPKTRFVGLYLTPDGDEPSDPSYFAIDYGIIAEVVKKLLDSRASTIGPDVKLVLSHYEHMLRRHIVSESEIAGLCRRLYRKHKHALDLIFMHRPDPRQGSVRELFEPSLERSPDFILDDSPRAYMRFLPKAWDVAALRGARGWTKSGRVLLFEMCFEPKRVFIKLTVGPGDAPLRQRLFDIATKHASSFKGVSKSLYPKFTQLFQRPLVDGKLLELGDAQTIETTARKNWETFAHNELPEIMAAFKADPSLGL